MSITNIGENEQRLAQALTEANRIIERLVNERDALAAELAKWTDADSKAGWINELRGHALAGAAAVQELDQYKVDLTEALIEHDAARLELATLQAKVASVHKAKGRYHSQLAMCDLYAACGLPNVRPISGGKP
jgi:GTP1/Obg family GTP-binding protein